MGEHSGQNGSFSFDEREAVYRAIFARRDVRKDFLPDPIPDETLRRVLLAAHHAGSVGYMQPWDFLVIRNSASKENHGQTARQNWQINC